MVSHSDAIAEGRPHALITGSRGFTGAYVRQILATGGYRVTGTVVGEPQEDEVVLDITSLEACREVIDQTRPTHIVHLAAISYVGHDDPMMMYRVNVGGTLNVLQACQDVGHRPEKILIASSANVYGNVGGVIHEDAVPQPVNHYAVSKLAMEFMVRTWFDRLPIVITRPFNYTGRGQTPRFLVPKIVSHFLDQKPVLELGNLDVARDFSDVRWVARVYRAILESSVVSDIVNVCSGEAYSLQQIIAMVSENTHFSLDVRVNPDFVRENEVKYLTGSAEKLHRLIPGIEAIDFRETLAWMTGSNELST